MGLKVLAIGLTVIIAAMSSGVQAQSPATPESSVPSNPVQNNWLAWTPPAADPPAASAPSSAKGDLKSENYLNEDTNVGEDFTRPVNRFDVRYKYEQTTGTVDNHTWTLRLDSKFDLPSKWTLSTRVDLPVVRNNQSDSGNPNGDYDAGLGNVLTQAILITPHVDRMAAGGGMRMTWPTVTKSQLGNEKYVLGPMLGAAYYPTWLMDGSLIGALARYEFSAGGNGSEIDKLIVQPLVNVNLPQRWFVNFQPEFAMNCRQDNHWFIPFDVMVGKKITEHIVTSVEWKQGLLKDYDQYDWSLEFRIGFFF